MLEKKLIIPAVLAKDFDDFSSQTGRLKSITEWLQLDVCDGEFVGNKTFDNSEEFKSLKGENKWEVHLMVKNTREEFLKWIDVGVSRMIVHWESAAGNLEEIIGACKEKKVEIGVAVNPATLVSELKPYLEKLDTVLIMSVEPGFGGQNFKDECLEKIKELRKIWPKGTIEVDGGVNKKNVRNIARAGADIMIMGSGMLHAVNLEKEYEMASFLANS